MNSYFVNTNAQANGDHEVHKEGCSYMLLNKIYLGRFPTCKGAVAEAAKRYRQVNGCYYCSKECHTQ